jgi:hypothetical protein
MLLPESWVKSYLDKSAGCTAFGHKLSVLSREELIAVAMAGWESEQLVRDDSNRERKFMSDMRKRLRGEM